MLEAPPTAVRPAPPETDPDRFRPAVELALVGGFELRHRGETHELPLSAQRLVAFVALHPRPLRRAFVAGSLWLDVPEDRAHANLRTALWRASAPGLGLIDASPTHLRLRAGAEVDARRLAALARGELDREPGAPAQRETSDLVHTEGELLPDWYDDWVLLERERLHHQRLHALESLAHRLRRERRYADAVDAALAAVAGEPLRETAHRALLAAHLDEGNVVEAVRGYRRFAELLDAELGLAPSAQMDALFADVGGPPAVTPR